MASSITRTVISVRYIERNHRDRDHVPKGVVHSSAMPFDARKLRGAEGGVSSTSLPGEIDYRLARQNLISEFKKGRIDRQEVCDAQGELMRAARNVGEASARLCPICEDANVVLLTYVFGPGMPPGGKCVTTKAELKAVSRGGGDLAAYVVEVCPACKWNHLARTFLIAGTRARSAPSA